MQAISLEANFQSAPKHGKKLSSDKMTRSVVGTNADLNLTQRINVQ